MPWAKILPLITAELGGRHPDDVFKEFEHEPFASASIAQVYRATTMEGQKVAVKVQKPAIPTQLEWDLCELNAHDPPVRALVRPVQADRLHPFAFQGRTGR